MTATTTPPRHLTEPELRARWLQSFPEAAGPGQESESGAVLRGDRITAHARVGEIPHLMDPAAMWAERAAEEARRAAIPPEVLAAEDLILTAMREGRRL